MICSECSCGVTPLESHFWCEIEEKNVFLCKNCNEKICSEYNIDGFWDLERIHVQRYHKQVDLI